MRTLPDEPGTGTEAMHPTFHRREPLRTAASRREPRGPPRRQPAVEAAVTEQAPPGERGGATKLYGERMAVGDGNGWVDCRCGHRHWGRFGAAGLLLLRRLPRDDGAAVQVLLQLRAAWTHEGGSWGLVGGARDSHEDVAQAALREAAEEAGIEPAAVRVLGEQVGVDHGDWHYTYVFGVAVVEVAPRLLTTESDDLRWVPLDQVTALPLHRGLDRAWMRLNQGIVQALAAHRG